MSAAPAIDHDVTAIGFAPLPDADDPVARLFFDHTTTSGDRLLAVAEPVHRSTQGYLVAGIALAAFEEALIVAIASGAETGLHRAFTAANNAVRASNRQTAVGHRAHAGITAVVIQGNIATVGTVPPGQALIIQDEQLYGIPDLKTWEPGYMPAADVNSPEPLGLAPVTRPQVVRTNVGIGDRFVLGTSAVGRVLATKRIATAGELSDVAMVERLENALAESGVDDAYAAWIKCDRAPAAKPIAPSRMAEIDRMWQAKPADPTVSAHGPSPVVPARRESQPAGAGDRLHSWLIEASERHLARRESECLPFEAIRRATTPPGAGSLNRYVKPAAWAMPQRFRSRLPRGLAISISKRAFVAFLAIAIIVGGIAVSLDVRRTSADKQDHYLKTVASEMTLADGAGTKAEKKQHLAQAMDALDGAQDSGADAEVIGPWREQIQQAQDQINGVSRLTAMERVGTLPASIPASSPRLLAAGSRLFLVTDGIYEIGIDAQQLMPVLMPGQQVGRYVAGPVLAASADGGRLLVSDGSVLFQMDASGVWTANPLAKSAGGIAWAGAIAGAYNGSFYVLDRDQTEISKFGAGSLDGDPTLWLSHTNAGLQTTAVDMTVDSKIRVLTSDGQLVTYFKNAPVGDPIVVDSAKDVTMVGAYGGGRNGTVYVVEIDNGRGKLIAIDLESGKRRVLMAPSHVQSEYDAAAVRAFAQTTDFVIDESAGLIYFVTPSGLWRASFAA